MSTENKEIKVKVLTEAEKAKAVIDKQGLTPAQIADLMVLIAKDIKKNVKSVKKEPKDKDAPPKEVNSGLRSWLDYTAQVREKVKELGVNVKHSNTQFCSYLKRKNLYPMTELSEGILEEEFNQFIKLSEDDKKASKKEAKVKESAAKTSKVKTEEVKPEPVKKVALKKVKEEIVIRPPEEGTYFKQKIKGVEYLTLAIDGDDMIYVFDLNKKAVGGYDVNSKELDQTIQVEFEEE